MSESEDQSTSKKTNKWFGRKQGPRVYSRPELEWGMGDDLPEQTSDSSSRYREHSQTNVPRRFTTSPSEYSQGQSPSQSGQEANPDHDDSMEYEINQNLFAPKSHAVGKPLASDSVPFEQSDAQSGDEPAVEPNADYLVYAQPSAYVQGDLYSDGLTQSQDPFEPYNHGDEGDKASIVIEAEHTDGAWGLTGELDSSAARSLHLEATRQRLDKALEKWWQQSELPPAPLLRDGLMLLEAGHSLDEVHLSLLLRTALRLNRGMLTALRHQSDSDRSAFLLKEALIDERYPLSPADVDWLNREDENSAEWSELLLDDLRVDQANLTGRARQSVDEVIERLDGSNTGLVLWKPAAIIPMPKRLIIPMPTPIYWNVGRMMLALLFVVLFISSWRWLQARSLLPNMVVVDAGSYSIGYNEIGALERSVTIPAPFAIDRTEVTNRSYQICYEQGACLAPLAPNTPTRTAYFLHRAYEQYPVVYVDWRRANQFCAWADKRLPTEDEWEVAAGAAPVTNRHFLYPWGERFNQLYANSARSGIKDTQQVGLYHPVGSSPIGAMDMAGNVAEWTFTVRPQDASNTYVVKGGSYVDEPEMLLVSNSSLRSADFTAPWLGFRCARTLAQPPE